LKILLYTQHGGLGGSFRLLLNLAEHLLQAHEVCVAFPRGQSGELTLAQYPGVRVLDCSEAQAYAAGCDVAIAHLTENLAFFSELRVPRKLALCVEVVQDHAPLFTDEALRCFDGYLHLHPEQAAHLGPATIGAKARLLPLVGNVRQAPDFRRTGNIGCIGAAHKLDALALLSVLDQLPAFSRTQLRVWSTRRPKIRRPANTWRRKMRFRLHQWTGRLRLPGPDPDILAVLGRFDLLLHGVKSGNGTSTVVSDALASGKMVLLSPLPAYKEAYARFAGVYFLDQPGLDAGQLLREYDEAKFQSICRSHADHYNRAQALRQWQETIEGRR